LATDTLKPRVLTVAVVLPLFLAALFYLPNRWWGMLMAVLLLVGGNEWSRLARFGSFARIMFLAALAAGCGALVIWPDPEGERWIYCVSLAFWGVAVPCWLRLEWRAFPSLLAVAGIIVLLPTWLALVRLQQTPQLLLILLAVVWIADTMAFFAGRRYGRRKLAAQISPGKTWEGVVGAFIAVVAYAWLAAGVSWVPGNAVTTVMGVFGLMAALSIIGDLFESWLKRVAGVKDSGRLLPGHGGVLDRIDGITAALPFAALIYVGRVS